jgi:hypothetical protein
MVSVFDTPLSIFDEKKKPKRHKTKKAPTVETVGA